MNIIAKTATTATTPIPISVDVEAEKGVEGEGLGVIDGEVEEVDGGGLWLDDGVGGEVRFFLIIALERI